MIENHALYFYIAFGAAVSFLALWILSVESRLKKFFKGKKAGNLEGLLGDISGEIEKINVSREETKKYLETVERRLKNSVQQVGVLRFNPFGAAGSNQSFAIALLDEKGNGVVISSLYSREKVNTYAKPIKDCASEYSLSEEEKEAINRALLSKSQPLISNQDE